MKKYNPIYYLLFILLVMGTFASMAQNSYGLRIMGGVAFVFALVFFIQCITFLRRKDGINIFAVIETACLFIVAIIFGFRVFYIYFPYVELLFELSAMVLAIVYMMRMLTRFNHFKKESSFLAFLIVVFHLSIILFLVSLAIFPFKPVIADITGIAAFIFLVFFLISALVKKDLQLHGEKVSAFKMIRLLKDHSIIIITLFILFSLYTGLNRTGLLPGIYSDEYPRAYFELLENSSSNKEKQVDGKYKYDEFIEEYQQFLEHNKINK